MNEKLLINSGDDTKCHWLRCHRFRFVSFFIDTVKEKTFAVKKIIGKEIVTSPTGDHSSIKYNVVWKDFSRSNDTWETLEHLHALNIDMDKVIEFENSKLCKGWERLNVEKLAQLQLSLNSMIMDQGLKITKWIAENPVKKQRFCILDNGVATMLNDNHVYYALMSLEERVKLVEFQTEAQNRILENYGLN